MEAQTLARRAAGADDAEPVFPAPDNAGLVNDREIARCLRQNHDPLDLTAAAVLHGTLTRPGYPLIAAISADHVQPAAPGITQVVRGWLSPKRATALIYPRKLLLSKRAPTRHPRFLGPRDDKAGAEVGREG